MKMGQRRLNFECAIVTKQRVWTASRATVPDESNPGRLNRMVVGVKIPSVRLEELAAFHVGIGIVFHRRAG